PSVSASTRSVRWRRLRWSGCVRLKSIWSGREMIRTTNHTIFFSLLLAGAVLLGALVHQLNAAQRAQLVTQLQETQTVLRATEVAQDVSLQQTNVSAAVQQTVTAHAPLLATQVVDLVVGTQQVVQATHIRERDIQATK